MNLLIIKNSNSQERSSPLVAVSLGYKTLDDAPVAGWGLCPSPELTEYSCLGHSGIYKMLSEPHCSPVVDKDHPGLLPYTALWQIWGQRGQTGCWASPTSQPHFLSCVKGTLDNRLSQLHCSMQPLNLAASTLQCWGAVTTCPPPLAQPGFDSLAHNPLEMLSSPGRGQGRQCLLPLARAPSPLRRLQILFWRQIIFAKPLPQPQQHPFNRQRDAKSNHLVWSSGKLDKEKLSPVY